ncbi:hypothetical protein CI105_02300 [Candidatus Izimaplasma bacterium ZiA1]|uniref:GNAT family N-acetyltransferase n=1 Tax=Candidatus Izimoplasma sp. ZiA1 TaxID=2024899 RepID=UPI000BAA44E5|nr:hypothetical protein CI105_02300 [Candidatus Izimaplasma bacterium ZiA1]
MIIKKVDFSFLSDYIKIPMFKEFDTIYKYNSLNEYIIEKTNPTIIDMNKYESIDLWKEILIEEHCSIFVCLIEDELIGGAIVVTNSPKVNMLNNDMTNAVLWDIRVKKDFQGKGISQLLFDEVKKYSIMKSCKRVIIETQNNNPKAISFYTKIGAKLRFIKKSHYQDLPDEDQLLFIYDL